MKNIRGLTYCSLNGYAAFQWKRQRARPSVGQLQDQIVEGLLAWHRHDSGGCVGMVDSTQENLWPHWYRQRVEMLWSTLNLYHDTGLTMQDKRILFRSRESLPQLFSDFNDNCVLVHGCFTLRSMLKDARSDQLLAMVGPGMMLWAPREYELFRLADGGLEQLLWRYLQRAPVAESFVWRRWLYQLWDEVENLVNTGRFDRARFSPRNQSCPDRLTLPSATASFVPGSRKSRVRCASANMVTAARVPRVKRRFHRQLVGWRR